MSVRFTAISLDHTLNTFVDDFPNTPLSIPCALFERKLILSEDFFRKLSSIRPSFVQLATVDMPLGLGGAIQVMNAGFFFRPDEI